jgi:hypothetical protein
VIFLLPTARLEKTMYNLLVSANENAWQAAYYDLEIGRALTKYTARALQDRYAAWNDESIAHLRGFPALFAYETANNQPARVGWITRVRHRNQTVRVEYEIEPSLPPIDPQRLLTLEFDLNLGPWEMNRTHWALKDVELLPVLMEAGLIDAAFVHAQPPQSRIMAIGLRQDAAEIAARPTVFRLPLTPREDDLVSVMMPFSHEMQPVYAAVEAACLQNQVRCQRADHIWEEPEVMQDVFSLIYRSKIVVCDFTGQNPNVFYEAGISHTLGRPVIPIAQNERDIPFDVRHHRYLPYFNNNEGREELTERLARRIRTLLGR